MADDLRTFCSGIADAIRTKKGTSDKINAQKFAEEILSIEGGGSGDGALIEGVNKIAVPNTGTVEKVYFDTNLSDAEVEALLNTLEYDSKMATLLSTTTGDAILVYNRLTNNKRYIVMWLYVASTDESMYIWANELGAEDYELDYAGWQDFTNPIEINAEVDSSVGLQNDLISDLFYIPETITKTLSGTYDGSSIVVTGDVDMAALIDEKKIPLSIKFGEKKTILVGSGIENVYCFPDGINCPAYDYDGDWSEFSEYLLPYQEEVTFSGNFLILINTNSDYMGLDIDNKYTTNVNIINNYTSVIVLIPTDNNAVAIVNGYSDNIS